MIGCLPTRVPKQLIIALYFESENELKFYNLGTRVQTDCKGYHRTLVKSVTKIQFSYFTTKTYVVGTQKNRLNERVLLSTQNLS